MSFVVAEEAAGGWLDWALSMLHAIASTIPARLAATTAVLTRPPVRHRAAGLPAAPAAEFTPFSFGQRPIPGEASNIDDGRLPRYHRWGSPASGWGWGWGWGGQAMWDPKLVVVSLLAAVGFGSVARAQDNYEIQVYGSETVAPAVTMFELHSNYTINGSTEPDGVVWPTNHAVHETLEITHGFTPWFETGFYVFSSYRAGGQGWDWVGDHIRPRVPGARDVELAGRGQPVVRVRVQHSAGVARHLDARNQADHR